MSQLVGSDSHQETGRGCFISCIGLGLRGSKSKVGRSRMNREIHVRFWGGLEVKFLRSTRCGKNDGCQNIQISTGQRVYSQIAAMPVISSDVS
jgi:hypothetical protein